MKIQKAFSVLSVLGILFSMFGASPAVAAPALAGSPTFTRQITSVATASFAGAGNNAADLNGVQPSELALDIRAAEAAGAAAHNAPAPTHLLVGRSSSHEDGHDSADPLKSPKAQSSEIAGTNPGLFASFNGLNHRQNRLASGGNQFTLEPPDQGMCAGNGFVMESVNDALRIYDTSGNPKTGVIALNAFYGYPFAINRSTGASGPFVTDPSCLFDSATQRWFNVILTLDVDPATGAFLGSNHLDIAVSSSADPTGSWVVYRLPVQNDGTDGTPDHACSFGPCIGDYPHIGADKNGFYITTNEYSLFGPEYKSAQIYAFSKSALAANSASVTVVQFDTTAAVKSASGLQPGFTVWPSNSPDGGFSTKAGGTEFFLSSNAGEEANNIPGGGFSNELIVWALTNTASLNSAAPNLVLSNKALEAQVYGIPPKADQKAGDFPLGQCLNDTSSLFGPGLGCWALFFNAAPANQGEASLDANDTRMQQTWYVGGKLYGSLDTVVKVGGQDKAGIAYFVVQPEISDSGKVDGNITKQGYVAVADQNVTYPALAVLPNGKGIMSFTLVGKDYYPSAAYVAFDAKKGAGAVHVAAAGLGPQDGFSGYGAFSGSGVARPRWGDYGAAATDGSNIWIASEYIAQTCTLSGYLTGAIGSCGGTRTSLANWGTRISGVTP